MELRLSESINDPLSVAISHRKLGECLSKCQDFKNAIIHQKEYLKVIILQLVHNALGTENCTHW